MKSFTKDMLAPGKHVVETRSGERYLVLECNGKIYLTNLERFFSTIDCFNVDMTYQSFSANGEYKDIMKVFIIASTGVMFDDRNLTEIWHREELFITPDEKAILRNIKGFNYIARTMDGNLYIYKIKPIKEADAYCGGCWHEFKMFNHLFQMVQWYNDEPWKIEDLLKLLEKGE